MKTKNDSLPTLPAFNDSNRKLFVSLTEYLCTDNTFINLNTSRRELAIILGTNETYLSRAVKTCTGRTLRQYVNSLRLDYSCRRLLDDPGTAITLIANECGFDSLRTYQRLFREKYQLTPSEFRKKAFSTGGKPVPEK